jgi:hypothetical protein
MTPIREHTQGDRIEAVPSRLGHNNIGFTLRRYTNLMSENQGLSPMVLLLRWTVREFRVTKLVTTMGQPCIFCCSRIPVGDVLVNVTLLVLVFVGTARHRLPYFCVDLSGSRSRAIPSS